MLPCVPQRHGHAAPRLHHRSNAAAAGFPAPSGHVRIAEVLAGLRGADTTRACIAAPPISRVCACTVPPCAPITGYLGRATVTRLPAAGVCGHELLRRVPCGGGIPSPHPACRRGLHVFGECEHAKLAVHCAELLRCAGPPPSLHSGTPPSPHAAAVLCLQRHCMHAYSTVW